MKFALLLWLLIWERGRAKRGRVGYWLLRGEDKGEESGGGGGVEESCEGVCGVFGV